MIDADLTVVTNIAPAHLELLGSLANVAAEKAQLQLCARDNARVILPASLLQYPAYLACADRAIVVAAEDESVIGDPQRVIRYRLDATAPTHTILYLTDDSGTEHFQVASTSRGICVNAALAIVAARELCITDSLIRDRLARWLPNSDRGGMVTRGRQSFYIDCYNANPSSMTDAIAAYNRAAPTGAGRCYILGAMDELGSDAEVLHQEVGQQLVLGPHDRVLFVGPQALTQAYTVGALEAGCSSDQLQCVSDVEKIKSIVAEFKGSLFLKGSRSYALEQLLPAEFR
jgi:UDP-N-acetylmuramoyl-tripeptide--D-alanyl-D-alanine ligase